MCPILRSTNLHIFKNRDVNKAVSEMDTVVRQVAFVNKKWLILPGIVAGFLFQHAIQGWCPPVPVFRRMGFRTSYEIDQERYALKAFRGDFGDVAGDVAKSAAAAGLKSNGHLAGAEA